ncbi:MAG TPA: hypothetical protein VFH88_06580 [Candidatus Krumholzibacteria bacterium]|nr:hypothetical protein [Candidatus Krumholzibacteria bacterium]
MIALVAMLLATALSSSSTTFDGFTIPIASEWGKPTVDGETTTIDGKVVQTVEGHSSVMVMHSVRITDLSGFEPIPEEGQVFDAHEQEMRSLPGMRAQNLRRSGAHLGSHDALVLCGSARVLDEAEHPQDGYVFSLVFVANNKVYEFSQVSMLESALDDAVEALPGFKIHDGDHDVPLSGGPVDLAGEYVISDVPFGVTLVTVPRVEGITEHAGYAIAYGASDLDPPAGPQYSYQLRRMNADDKRTDNQLFWDLARTMLDTETVFNHPERFVVKDHAGTVNAEYTMGKPMVARFLYRRVGQWIAVLAARTTQDHRTALDRFGLRVLN